MAGLPMTYVVALFAITAGGFVATLSFVWLGASAVIGYATLRALTAYDARLMDVIFTAISKTPPTPSWYQGKGIVYRA